MTKLNDQNFEEEIINFAGAALVDFWAPWCGPCKMQGPIIEELAKKYSAKNVKIAKLNVDENPATAQKYDVISIPSLILFKGGKEVERLIGMQAEDILKKKIDGLL